MASFRTACLAVLMEFGTIVACHAQPRQADLEWQVKVPVTLFYRAISNGDFDARYYFKDAEFAVQDWTFRRELYVHDDCANSQSPVYCSEQKLGPKRVAMMRARLKDKPARGNSWLAEAYLANFSSYWIWYRLYDQNYLREVLGGDVYAQVRLASTEDPNATCTMPDVPKGSEKRCTDWFDVSIPRGREHTLALLRVQDGKRFETQARVRQLTILGLGDSFGSGEGTPDVPADFAGRPPPGRQTNSDLNPTAAQWLERNCHRSLLGPQARAVIQYAALHPHVEVNFIYVPCSGAAIDEGILQPYAGFENSSHTVRMRRAQLDWLANLSQLNQVMMALCRDMELPRPRMQTRTEDGVTGEEKLKKLFGDHVVGRLGQDLYRCRDGFLGNGSIDAVLLSAGGNDAEFFSVVKQAVLPRLATAIVLYSEVKERLENSHVSVVDLLLERGQQRIRNVLSPRQAIERAQRLLSERYAKLDEVFETHLGITDPSRILIALYPNQNRDQAGRLCNTGEGLEEFNAFAKEEWMRALLPPYVNRDESRELERFAHTVNDIIRGAPYRNNRKWTIVQSHLAAFEHRGWCARDEAPQAHFDAGTETRRLVRTPNDGVLVQNQLIAAGEIDVLREPVGPRMERLIQTYGLFHPNNFGAAIMADAYLKEMNCLLDMDCSANRGN
jgi:hypothetical protein